MNDLERIVAERANNRWDLGLTATQLAQFSRYADLLADWNQRMNLTRIVLPEAVAVKHFLDSLSILHVIDVPPGLRLIDVGSGAGFPGLALKIARPDLAVTLLDSTAKKLTFCAAVAADLGLDVATVHARAEDAGRMPEHARAYDLAVARAVAPLDRLLPWCAPFVKGGGRMALLKGPSVDFELAAARSVAARLHLAVDAPVRIDLPGEEASAHFVLAARMRRL